MSIKKVLIWVGLPLLGFLVGFVAFFPMDTLIGSILSKNNIPYRKVEGDFFNLQLKGVDKGLLKVENLKIKNKVYQIEVEVDEKNKAYIKPFPFKAEVKLNGLDLSKVLKGDIKGNVYGNVDITKEGEFMVADGSLEAKGLKILFVDSINVKAKLKAEGKKTKVEAEINSPQVNGRFTGFITVPYNNIDEAYIKGRFVGSYYGKAVNQQIDTKVKGLLW
ncbi:MAG: hypothetical protein GXO45_06125 [Aquificae bacterium]|nr:hypothetical protein [Aquificota bacterium]